MQIHIEYASQLRVAVESEAETIECDAGESVNRVLDRLASIHGEQLKALLFDAEGNKQPWVWVEYGGELLQDLTHPLQDGDTLRLMSPISGG